MIEEFSVPQWASLLVRMTRRRLRLGTQLGHAGGARRRRRSPRLPQMPVSIPFTFLADEPPLQLLAAIPYGDVKMDSDFLPSSKASDLASENVAAPTAMETTLGGAMDVPTTPETYKVSETDVEPRPTAALPGDVFDSALSATIVSKQQDISPPETAVHDKTEVAEAPVIESPFIGISTAAGEAVAARPSDSMLAIDVPAAVAAVAGAITLPLVSTKTWLPPAESIVAIAEVVAAVLNHESQADVKDVTAEPVIATLARNPAPAAAAKEAERTDSPPTTESESVQNKKCPDASVVAEPVQVAAKETAADDPPALASAAAVIPGSAMEEKIPESPVGAEIEVAADELPAEESTPSEESEIVPVDVVGTNQSVAASVPDEPSEIVAHALHPESASAAPAPAATVISVTIAPPEKPAAPPPSPVLAPAVQAQFNRTGLDFRRPIPRPKVNGIVIDMHCHLLAARHADHWFEAADHYGIDCFVTMSPLEEAVGLQRDWGHRVQFIAVPRWSDSSSTWVDEWLTRIEGFYNLGSRIAKFHAAPGTMNMRGHRLDEPVYKPLLREVASRKMAIMTHVGDPDTWYAGKYADAAKYGTRDEHYRMWADLLEEFRGTPWVGAHLGGNPEDLPRLQSLLDRFPDLVLDCSATRWMAREVSARRDAAREFFIRNQDRILFGSDQVSFDDRGFDFLASRFWVHRKLWETAYIGPSPILDPDVSPENQPTLRGLALPDEVLQKMYHDNPIKLLAKVGAGFGGWG